MAGIGSITWEWNNEGFHEILNCDELADLCYETAEEIAAKGNAEAKGDSPFTTNPYKAHRWHSNMKGGRVAAVVKGSTYGNRLEAKRKSLSKAVSACRD